MAAPLHIVVTCTKRKTQPPLAALVLRSLRAGSIQQRTTDWLDRVRGAGSTVTAEALYAGDHWQVVRSLPTAGEAIGRPVRLWVCSAGYGLVSLASKLSLYSATFSSKHPDSVCQNLRGTSMADAPTAWWRLLSSWEGPEPGTARSLTDLFASAPRSHFWVVASEVYLAAIADDLRRAVAALADQNRLAIFSAGTRTLADLTDHLVPCDARLQRVVGGARRSLNVRLARKALEEAGPGAIGLDDLRARFGRLLALQPALVAPVRQPMTDAALKSYIKTALAQDPYRRPTPLLRQLRDSGRACEARRFVTLYRRVTEQRDHGQS